MGGDLGDLQTYHGARLIFIKMIKIVSYLVQIIWKFMNIKMTEKLFILEKIQARVLGVPMIFIFQKNCLSEKKCYTGQASFDYKKRNAALSGIQGDVKLNLYEVIEIIV